MRYASRLGGTICGRSARRFGFIVLLAMVLAGCAGTMHNAVPAKPLTLPAGSALFFGRVVVAEDDQPVALGGAFGLPARAMFIRLDGDGEEFSAPLGDDGAFYFTAPRGTYLLAQVAGTFDPKAAFRVPSGEGGAAAYYLGTLRLDVAGQEKLIGKTYALARVRLDDEFDEARESLAKRFPDFDGPVEKDLMVQSDEIPAAAEARQDLRERESRRALLSNVYNVLRALSIH